MVLLLASNSASAATRYVDVNSASPTPPYTNWATAARVIQNAVDTAATGDTVLVTNGVYIVGGRDGNRVAITNSIQLESVSGPSVTTIDGGGSVRCVSLASSAILRGFTLTNGYVQEDQGGGAYGGTLSNCTLTGNSAGWDGGGAAGSTLLNCVLTGNSANGSGGGASYCTLNNCTLTGNSASYGGGASYCTLNNCTLTGNRGDATDPWLSGGGGAYGSTLTNCIVYYNSAVRAANYDDSSTLNYCCTTPLPPGGTGNITTEPQLASTSHLSASSPCRSAGSAQSSSGVDIDGELWVNPPSIGCDEYHAGAVTGSLTVTIFANYTTVATGFSVEFRGQIGGHASASRWEFGGSTVVSNQPYASHSWASAGDYPVVLRAYNESNPGGVTATVTVQVVEPPVHYVALNSINPRPPYTTWATAATNIQDAVDAANVPGALVLVTNGVYIVGGRDFNRVAITNSIRLESFNGPSVTTINGGGSVRCVLLAADAVLSGFTLTNGYSGEGGGVWCASASAVLTNCVLTGNSAHLGGGAYGGTLYNCTLIANMTFDVPRRPFPHPFPYPGIGGGAYGSTLYDCTLTSNSATFGGGAYLSTLYNCTFTRNSAGWAGGGASGSTLYNCTLTGNSAYWGGGADATTLNDCTLTDNSAWMGGGAYGGTLNNCTLTGNSAREYGGGAFGGVWGPCTLNNCTVTGNSATWGGGASGGTLTNCTILDNLAWDSGGGVVSSVLANSIVAYNAAWVDPNHSGSTLDYCLTTPLPTAGEGNIAVPPRFVDYLAGDLRLQPDSPCINAGLNAFAPGPTDLDGKPRIASGTVDIGAYEFQEPGSLVSYAWLQHYGLPTDGSADGTDPDADGHTTWQEWRCQTDPTNALSALRLLSATRAGTNVMVSWQSVSGVDYFLERSTNISGPPPLFAPLATGIPGQPGTTTYADTNAAPLSPLFYRVGVRP